MVSAAVVSALPVDVPPLLLEMALVTELASALALFELVEAVVCAVGFGGVGRHRTQGVARRLGLLAAARIARRGAEVDAVEHLRVLPVLRCDLHHHEVLIERVENRRHGALAKRIVENVVDLIRREAVRIAVARLIVI